MADAADDDSCSEEPHKQRHFRFVDVLTEVPNGDAASAKELLLEDRLLTSIETLESCRSLKKLELRGNLLGKLDFLDMNHELCWLGLAKNRFRRLSHLDNLRALAVLDISDNRIVKLDGLSGLVELKALIAVRNRIVRIEGLSPKKNPKLETLVLSHNQISECSLMKFAKLRKLSLGHNKLHGFPQLAELPSLAELRLNSNKLISVDSCVATLQHLSILDVGNNLVTKLSALEPLRGLLRLKSLSVLGNAVAEHMETQEMCALLASLPKLEIVNNKRLVGKSQKKRRQGRAQQAGTSSAIAAVEVHGRAFEGKRAVFEDSEDEHGSSGFGGSQRVRGDRGRGRVGRGRGDGNCRREGGGRDGRGSCDRGGRWDGWGPAGSRHESWTHKPTFDSETPSSKASKKQSARKRPRPNGEDDLSVGRKERRAEHSSLTKGNREPRSRSVQDDHERINASKQKGKPAVGKTSPNANLQHRKKTLRRREGTSSTVDAPPRAKKRRKLVRVGADGLDTTGEHGAKKPRKLRLDEGH